MREGKDFEDPFEGEEGEATTLPLSCTWGISILSLLLACEDWTGESTEEIQALGLTGGGGGDEKLG
jgi:hypothetical protein